MKLSPLTLAIIAFDFCSAGFVRAADDADAIKKKRDDLRAKQDVVYKEINDIRRKIEKSDAVASPQQLVADAKKAYDAKLAASAKMTASKKNIEELTAKSRTLTEAELVASPEVQAVQKEILAADDAWFDADSAARIAEFVLSEMKRKAGRDHSLDALRSKTYQTEEAFYNARQNNKDVEAAKAARMASFKALEDAVTAKVAATPEGAAQIKKIEELTAKAKEARTAAEPLQKKWYAARTAASKNNAKIIEANKTLNDAYAAQTKLAHEEAAAERAEMDKAQRALDDAVRAKMDADPNVAELKKILEGLQEQVREANAELKAAADKK